MRKGGGGLNRLSERDRPAPNLLVQDARENGGGHAEPPDEFCERPPVLPLPCSASAGRLPARGEERVRVACAAVFLALGCLP